MRLVTLTLSPTENPNFLCAVGLKSEETMVGFEDLVDAAAIAVFSLLVEFSTSSWVDLFKLDIFTIDIRSTEIRPFFIRNDVIDLGLVTINRKAYKYFVI